MYTSRSFKTDYANFSGKILSFFYWPQKHPIIRFDDIQLFLFMFNLPMSDSAHKHTHLYTETKLKSLSNALIVVRFCLVLIIESDEFHSK